MYFRIKTLSKQNMKVEAKNLFTAFVEWIEYFERSPVNDITVHEITKEEYLNIEEGVVLHRAQFEKEDKFIGEGFRVQVTRGPGRGSKRMVIPASSFSEATDIFLEEEGLKSSSREDLFYMVLNL